MIEEWFSAGHHDYKPGWEKWIERCPDRRPSLEGFFAEQLDNGRLIMALPVRQLGGIVVTTRGVSIFTRSDIYFESSEETRIDSEQRG